MHPEIQIIHLLYIRPHMFSIPFHSILRIYSHSIRACWIFHLKLVSFFATSTNVMRAFAALTKRRDECCMRCPIFWMETGKNFDTKRMLVVRANCVNNVFIEKRQHRVWTNKNVIVSECHHTNVMLHSIHLKCISCNLKCIWCHCAHALTICLHKQMITFQQDYWKNAIYTLRMTQYGNARTRAHSRRYSC